MPPSIPPDWYPDPTKRFEWRYWDGSHWSDRVSTGDVISTDSATFRAVGPSRVSPRAQKKRNRSDFETVSVAAARGDRAALAALPGIVDRARQSYRGTRYVDAAMTALALAVHEVMADDVLTADEERHLTELAGVLGVPLTEATTRNYRLHEEFAIGLINGGQLPQLRSSPLVTKGAEVVHACFAVALVKEPAAREWRGQSQGVSIQLRDGASYHIGQVRARSVSMGDAVTVKDAGPLILTNHRGVFMGRRRREEFRYDQVGGVEQYTDGLRLTISHLFKVGRLSVSNQSGFPIRLGPLELDLSSRGTALLLKFDQMQSPAIAAAILASLVDRANRDRGRPNTKG